jgi:hypothetical protein
VGGEEGIGGGVVLDGAARMLRLSSTTRAATTATPAMHHARHDRRCRTARVVSAGAVGLPVSGSASGAACGAIFGQPRPLLLPKVCVIP